MPAVRRARGHCGGQPGRRQRAPTQQPTHEKRPPFSRALSRRRPHRHLCPLPHQHRQQERLLHATVRRAIYFLHLLVHTISDRSAHVHQPQRLQALLQIRRLYLQRGSPNLRPATTPWPHWGRNWHRGQDPSARSAAGPQQPRAPRCGPLLHSGLPCGALQQGAWPTAGSASHPTLASASCVR